MIETALIMPLYMLVLLGLLYFGYATLYQQRQDKAAAYAAWMTGSQSADDLLAGFWHDGASDDLKLTVTESQFGQEDVYYNDKTITHQIDYSLASARYTDTFSNERIAVSLWNYALGDYVQSFVWDASGGLTEVMTANFGDRDSPKHYLNAEAPGSVSLGGGFVYADNDSPPLITSNINQIASVLNGPGADHWLERRQASLDTEYTPSYLPAVFSGTDQDASSLYALGKQAYPSPSYTPRYAVTMGLTGRSGAGRLAAGEQGMSCDGLLDEAAWVFGIAVPETGNSTQDLWRRR